MEENVRVLVELLDKDPIKNVLGPCIFTPDVVVYLCDGRDSSFFKESAIIRLFRRRKMKTQPRFLYFDGSGPENIRRVLAAVGRDYPGCVFDYTGGRDLVLLVAGAYLAQTHLPGFYIDIPAARLVSVHGCEYLYERFRLPLFPVEDILAMAGATISGSGHFLPMDMDDAFEEQALAAFEIVLRNPKAWGGFVSWLQGFCAGTPPGHLEVEGQRRLKRVNANTQVLKHLQAAGLLARVDTSNNRIRIVFPSALHKKCLLIEGIWLELYCYITAKRSGYFNDVRTSVVVDWDGVEGGNDNTKNEVDVLLARAVTPVFISCKMSMPSPLALSEIRLLATKFGGSEARAVLVTAAQLKDNHKALRTRAGELGIFMLDSDVITRQDFAKKLLEIALPPRRVGTGPRLVDAAMLPADGDA